MKRFIFAIATALTLLSCSSNATDSIIDAINECTKKLETVKSSEDIDKAVEDLSTQIQDIKKANPDYEPNAEDKKRIFEASSEMSTALMKAGEIGIKNEIPEPMAPAPADTDTDK